MLVFKYMKKIFQYSVMMFMFAVPFISHGQTTSGTCTGEIRTDLVAATDCINKATAQGQSRGYTMSCTVEQLPLGGFTDPTSGKDYILNPVCTVNGSEGHGAYLLAGFTAAAGSNAIIQSVNPGWDILKTELAYESAFAQCGGKAPYGSVVNGVSVYSCTPPPGALPVPASSVGSTKVGTGDSLSTEAAVKEVLKSIFSVNQGLLQNIMNRYGEYSRTMLNPGTTTVNTPVSTTPNSQCYQFTKTLQVGSSGLEVYALTYALKHEGFLSQTSSVFDTTTMTAVKRFQEAHATEILNILGLTQGTGVMAEKTRAYLNSTCIVPASISLPTTPTTTSCAAPTRTGIKNGVYRYTFTQRGDNWVVTLNNPAYRTPGDPYYVPANFSFTAPNALDLNRQNQGKFNYLQSLPGTAEGNTEYANLFGSFNNAYYDWNALTSPLGAGCANPTVNPNPTSGITVPTLNIPATAVRYIKISVADWDTLPLALREIVVVSKKGTLVKPVAVTATNFDAFSNTVPANLIDGNENSIWKATKSIATCSNRVTADQTAARGSDGAIRAQIQCSETDGDLQVITLDLGQAIELDQVRIVNYGFTDTRVFVIEVGSDDRAYSQIAEVRARTTAPIVDKGVVYGVMKSASTVGPLLYPLP